MFSADDVKTIKYGIDILEDQMANGSQLDSTQENLEQMKALLGKVENSIAISPTTIVLQSILFERSVIKEFVPHCFDELAGCLIDNSEKIADGTFVSLWNALTVEPSKTIVGIGEVGRTLSSIHSNKDVTDEEVKRKLLEIDDLPAGLCDSILTEVNEAAGDDSSERMCVVRGLSLELLETHQALSACEL